MRSEDYDAFLVYSTRIFTCLTYAEYRQTFKYLQCLNDGFLYRHGHGQTVNRTNPR